MKEYVGDVDGHPPLPLEVEKVGKEIIGAAIEGLTDVEADCACW